MEEDPTILARLMAVIQDRVRHRPAESYTARLLDGGVDVIGAKIREEAGELIEAARSADSESSKTAVAHEAADLFYHVLVMMGLCGVGLADVEAELGRRFGVSGLDEKASRPPRTADR